MYIDSEISLQRVSEYKREKIPILALHGLNQNPLSLIKLLNDISQDQYCSYLLHLPGHFAGSPIKDLTEKDFLRATSKALEIIKKEHDFEPMGLGYSLGGLLLIQQSLKQLILLAPALELKGYTFLLKALIPWVSKVKSLPLETLEFERYYRYHQNGVPVQVYKSFFSIYSDWQKKKNEVTGLMNKHQTKTLIFSHPKDEIVSHLKLKSWALTANNHLFYEVDRSQASLKRFNHLFVDEVTLGQDSYQLMIRKIQSFLKNP